MTEYIPPFNDNERLGRAKESLNTGEEDIARGNNYVGQQTITQLSNLIPYFENALKRVTTTLSEREKEVRESNMAFVDFRRHIRDFWEVLKRRIKRKGYPAEVLTLYGLTLDGIVPKPKSRSEWFTLGEELLEGEKQAVLKGYPAMLNPDITEVAQALADARAEADNVALADRAYDEAQEMLAKLRL